MITVRNVTNMLRQNVRQKYSLPELPYEYNALEPIISEEIMCLHHQKHHNAYVTNYNAAEDKLHLAQNNNDTTAIISLAPALKFNGGGHINHSIFWKNLSPSGGELSQPLLTAIKKDFGSLDAMKFKLSTAAIGIQGSGWGWLGYNKAFKRLEIATCANQDPLEATIGLVPLFGIDVWEHAYYLQYKNVRADYVKAIFDIANWSDVSDRYNQAKCDTSC